MTTLNSKILTLFILLFFATHICSATDIKLKNEKLYKTYVFGRDSSKYFLNDYLQKGEIKMVVIFTDWCGPCHALLDTLNNSQDVIKYLYKTDIVPIAVSFQKVGMKLIDKVAQQRKWNFNILYDCSNDIKNSFRVAEVPHVMFINKSGRIVYESVGFKLEDFTTLMRALRKVYKAEYSTQN